MSFRKLHGGCLAIGLLTAFALCPSWSQADDDLWTTSFQKAKASAEKQEKDVLMEFTGSDWCPPCKALHANVLSQDVFKTEAPKLFVLLKLDNPRDKSNQTEEEQAQYRELSSKYKVTGVPTIILADEQGRPYVKMVGYGRQTAEEYVEQLVEKAETRKQRDDAFEAAADAEGAEKAKLLDEGLSVLDPELAVAYYEDTIEQIVQADANDEAGLKSKYQGILNLTKAKASLAVIRQGHQDDASEATLEKIQKLIEELKLEGPGLQEALYLKGFIQFRAGQREAAQKTLEEALALAPESEKGRQITRILNTVFKGDEKKDSDE